MANKKITESKCIEGYTVQEVNYKLNKFLSKLERGNYSIYHISNIIQEVNWNNLKEEHYSLIIVYNKEE